MCFQGHHVELRGRDADERHEAREIGFVVLRSTPPIAGRGRARASLRPGFYPRRITHPHPRSLILAHPGSSIVGETPRRDRFKPDRLENG